MSYAFARTSCVVRRFMLWLTARNLVSDRSGRSVMHTDPKWEFYLRLPFRV